MIWLNGAFGVGKTSVADELLRIMSEASVFDPESLGNMLRAAVPGGYELDDFQDIPTWRDVTLETVLSLVRRTGRTVVVPMTLVDRRFFDEVVGVLRSRVSVAHFTLVASRETIMDRLVCRERTEGDPPDWARARTERCVEELADPSFRVHFDSERRSPTDIAHAVAEQCLGS